MPFNYAKLKGRIVEKYGTQGQFADVLGVVPLTVSRKLNNGSAFTREEIIQWANALDIPKDEIISYFFD